MYLMHIQCSIICIVFSVFNANLIHVSEDKNHLTEKSAFLHFLSINSLIHLSVLKCISPFE